MQPMLTLLTPYKQNEYPEPDPDPDPEWIINCYTLILACQFLHWQRSSLYLRYSFVK